MNTTKPYEDRIRERVTADERAGHRNLLGEIAPIVRSIDALQRHGVAMLAFSSEEREVIEAARRVLDRKLVPMALVPQPEPESSPFLIDR